MRRRGRERGACPHSPRARANAGECAAADGDAARGKCETREASAGEADGSRGERAKGARAVFPRAGGGAAAEGRTASRLRDSGQSGGTAKPRRGDAAGAWGEWANGRRLKRPGGAAPLGRPRGRRSCGGGVGKCATAGGSAATLAGQPGGFDLSGGPGPPVLRRGRGKTRRCGRSGKACPHSPPVYQTPGNGPPGQGPEAARFRKRNKKDVVLCAGMI